MGRLGMLDGLLARRRCLLVFLNAYLSVLSFKQSRQKRGQLSNIFRGIGYQVTG